MKAILKEHAELATRLAKGLTERWLNDELDKTADCYEAADAATIELRDAMYRQYDMDALADVVALFDEVLEATRMCGSVSGSLWRNVRDEDGEVVEFLNAKTWAEADWAEIATDGVNYRASRTLTRYETFAATVEERIMECFSEQTFSEEETEQDGEYQWFRLTK